MGFSVVKNRVGAKGGGWRAVGPRIRSRPSLLPTPTIFIPTKKLARRPDKAVLVIFFE